MNVHISYKLHKTPDIEKEINHHIEKLGKRLHVFRPDLVHLKGAIEQNSARDQATVSLNLRLPSGQLAAQESAATAVAAIKAAFDDLMQQTNKHKDLLRNSHRWARRRVADFRGDGEVPFEQTVASVHVPVASSDDIRSYVNANLGRLELYISRELYFREAAAQLPSSADSVSTNSISKEEVIDEVVARALSENAEKPERLALEPWLYHLATQAMNDLAMRNPEDDAALSLEESIHAQDVSGSDEPALQFYQPDESVTEESVIADSRLATPEDIAYSDEIFGMMQLALKDASPADRQAFVLHAIEGFSLEEITMITGRKREQVRSSIGAARDCLRRALPEGRFKSGLMQAAASD
jgi:RNA polymerase sigma factor (sigma-70 family)